MSRKARRLIEKVASDFKQDVFAAVGAVGDESTEDIAIEFIESEVGRYDWMRNWPVYKTKWSPVHKVGAWMRRVGYEGSAKDVVRFIDWMVVNRPGRWH